MRLITGRAEKDGILPEREHCVAALQVHLPPAHGGPVNSLKTVAIRQSGAGPAEKRCTRSGCNISITRFISNFKERLRNRSAQHHMDPGAAGAVCASDSWTTSKQCIVHVLGAVRCGRYQAQWRLNPPYGGQVSIWSCAWHNGMTGAGSDRDAGPTPVQRARFPG